MFTELTELLPLSIFFILGSTPFKAEHQPQGIELQEKQKEKDEK